MKKGRLRVALFLPLASRFFTGTVPDIRNRHPEGLCI